MSNNLHDKINHIYWDNIYDHQNLTKNNINNNNTYNNNYNCYKCHLCNNNASNFNISPYDILLPWCSKCYAKNLINVVKLGNNDKICHTCASFGKKTILLDNDMIPIGASLAACIDCINKYGIEKKIKIGKNMIPWKSMHFKKELINISIMIYTKTNKMAHLYLIGIITKMDIYIHYMILIIMIIFKINYHIQYICLKLFLYFNNIDIHN